VRATDTVVKQIYAQYLLLRGINEGNMVHILQEINMSTEQSYQNSFVSGNNFSLEAELQT
jgi:hypothetical protein